MEKLTEIIMLPTDKKINEAYLSINQIFIDKSDSKKYVSTQNHYDKKVLEYFTPQHLYFVRKEEINEYDWYIWLDNKQIHQASGVLDILNEHVRNGDIKKIISSTDPYLDWIEHNDTLPYPSGKQHRLPRPSIEFLEKYCELEGTDKVMVEYETNQLDWKPETKLFMVAMGDDPDDFVYEPIYQLKVTSNNTIITHFI